MRVVRVQPIAKGPAEFIAGDVWFNEIAEAEDSLPLRVSWVRFTPGTRTAWHSHSLGQTFYVTEGQGLVQSRGGKIVNIRSGDVICTAPNEWHWHGTAPDHFMTYLSVMEGDSEGKRPDTEWGAQVSDGEYRDST